MPEDNPGAYKTTFKRNSKQTSGGRGKSDPFPKNMEGSYSPYYSMKGNFHKRGRSDPFPCGPEHYSGHSSHKGGMNKTARRGY